VTTQGFSRIAAESVVLSWSSPTPLSFLNRSSTLGKCDCLVLRSGISPHNYGRVPTVASDAPSNQSLILAIICTHKNTVFPVATFLRGAEFSTVPAIILEGEARRSLPQFKRGPAGGETRDPVMICSLFRFSIVKVVLGCGEIARWSRAGGLMDANHRFRNETRPDKKPKPQVST